ncbi:DNA polymerase lambda-like [Ananas comosus]|uniref:DNA polymerase lambda-like n=1 Tax=Ananas comosus TaxID=4615 RepID=A0A6P5GZJ5_ANACO|nr:DNA polymerase lambda-like [Ananas comosus]
MAILIRYTRNTPLIIIVCGGSYRCGKSSCGDLDTVITHPDGESHKGFLPRYIQYLKDINFLREDLVFSMHSTGGTDSRVDTYFGLCTHPGQELRHHIDFKVQVYSRGVD